jgi:DNA-binding SARP family transcriptional activator/DNA-binding beta-propeller fold protein YncE
MRYRVLGPVEVRGDGLEQELGAGRQRVLLALLLLHRNQLVATDRIIDALWDERPPATAAKVVQGYVSQLRKALGEGVLLTRPPGYVLAVPSGQLDADRFEELVERARREEPRQAAETLRKALGIWRGPPFADMAYESFAQTEIARLQELRLAALEDRIDADLTLGRARELIPELEVVVHEEPLRERPRAQLMLALYRAGRQSEALDLYADSYRRFVHELGIEPGPELRELQRQILAQDPSLGRVPRPTPLTVVTRQRWKLLAGGAALVAVATTAVALGLTRGEPARVATGPNMVGVIDPDSNRLVDAFSVGGVPIKLTTGGNAVWVVNSGDGTISRIEPQTRSVRTFSTGALVSGSGIAVGPDSAWVTNGDGTVSRIDPRSVEVLRTIRLPGGGDKVGAGWIVASPLDVWAAGGTRAGGLAWRIDPHTNKVTRTVSLEYGARAVAIAGDSVWVRDDPGLVRLDRRSGRLEERLALSSRRCCEMGGLAAGEGSLWVADHGRAVVWRVDSGTGRIVATIPVRGKPSGVAVGAGAVWVADQNGTILRINANTNQVVARIAVGGSPTAVAFAYGRLWIALD